jgi:tape measure domain-containing protein
MSENIAKYNVILELLTNTKGVDEAEKKVGGLQKTFNVAKGAFAGIIAANVVQSGISLIGGLVSKSIELSSAYEQTKVAFDTFLGDSEKAEQVLSELNKFSIETPFEPDQVNQAAKSLLAFGLSSDQLIPKLTQIGDISSATGKDFNELATIFGKAKVAGTLFAEDINQLTEAGIPVIQEFAKQLGVSESQVKKLASEGKISFKNLEQAFTDLTSEGGKFQGLMLAQSQTFGGFVSSLKGVFDEILRGFGDVFTPILKGLFVPLTQGLFSLLDGFKKIQPVVTGFFKGLFTFLGNTLGPLVDAFKRLGSTIFEGANSFSFFRKILDGVSGTFRLVVAGLTFFIDGLTKVISFLKTSDFPFIEALRNGFGSLVILFQNLPAIIAGTVAAVKQAGVNIIDFFTITTLQAQKLINDFQAFLGSESAKAESKRLKDRISRLKSDSKTVSQAFNEAFKEEVDNRIKIEELEKKAATKRDLKAKEDQKKQDVEAGNVKKKTQEELNKELLAISEERVKKEFALREKAKRDEIKDAQELAKQLEILEVTKQIALLTVKRQYAKDGTSDAIELENQIKELEGKYNTFFNRVKADPLDFLGVKDLGNVKKQAEILQNELNKLKISYNLVSDPKVKDGIKAQIEQIQSEIAKFQSPKLNKLTFQSGGFDAIDLDQLLPKDRVPALQDRLGLVTDAVEQVKAKLKAGLGDPLDLQAFDSLREEGENIIALLERLGIEIPKMSEKIIKGTGDVLGISPETFKLIGESVDVARDAFQAITDVYVAELDNRIALQEDRVKQAEKIAEKGNVKQLEIEEERLAKLTEERQKAAERAAVIEKAAAQAQIIVNTALTISNLQVAAASTAAQTGVAAPITVPVILAIVGGLIASAANLFKPPSFIEGTEMVQSDSRFGQYKKSNGQDGYTARFDGKERIVDPITNSKLNGFPNAMLPEAVKYYQMRSKSLPVIAMSASKDNSMMESKLDALKESFEALRINVSLDQKGFIAEIDRLQQKRLDRQRYKA